MTHADAGWAPSLTLLHLSADGLIGVAYTFIAGILAYIVYQHRRLLPFDWVVLAFGLFIVACGTTHFMHVLVLYVPAYWLDGYLRGVTAVVSVATAVALPPLIPRIAQLLNAEQAVAAKQAELERSNLALEAAVRRAEMLTVLGETLQTAATSEEAQRAALELLGPGLGAQAMLVVTGASGHLTVPTTWGTLPTPVAATLFTRTFTRQELPVLFQAMETRQAVYLDVYPQQLNMNPELAALAFGVEPILHRSGTAIGAVTIWRRADSAGWSVSERAVMQRAAGTIALALERTQETQRLQTSRAALEIRSLELAAANEELEAFTYSASHDLRTPVRHVISFGELAERALTKGQGEKAADYLGVVQREGHRMNTLIDGMLTLSRTRQQELIAQPVPLGRLVQQAQRDVLQEFAATTVRWQVSSLPAVWGDAGLLQQVMTNLISNAVKYSGTRPVTEVSIEVQESPEEWVISVQDNGVGFDPAYAQRLFGVFQRLHSAREFEGTGVGLATVKRIVTRHGGQVFAHSKPGQGATFGFTLPRPPA
ncbi:ATP-binding protein [Deinococcus oregonensis]|uniref:histidine kinase n=1 Tax=Deinococcus oregonensis TaxID=1805970 RepID=A0ABV6B4T4_9DEIO